LVFVAVILLQERWYACSAGGAQGLVKCMSWVGATVPWLLLLWLYRRGDHVVVGGAKVLVVSSLSCGSV
jgi:hypothetical protein